MRFVKLAIISAVVLFGLATAMSLLLPSTVIVSRPIDLQVSPDSVYRYLMELENWENWLEHDENAKFVIEQQAKRITYQNTHISMISSEPTKITTEWQVGEGRTMLGEFHLISHPNITVFTLQWQFTQKLNWYPWEKFASILSDKALGPYMEKSLLRLKERVEPAH